VVQRDSQGGKVERLHHRRFGTVAIAALAAVFLVVLSARADAQSAPPTTPTTKPTTPTTKPATPATEAPGAPTITAVTSGNQKAEVAWKISEKKGATQATKFEITPYRGKDAQPSVTVDAPATTATVTGLHNNAAYTFKVVAVDSQGHKSKDSLASKVVTPKASASSAWYKRKRYWAVAFVVLAVLIGLGLFFFLRRGKKPTEEESLSTPPAAPLPQTSE
jgi:Fibronectin type III domain